MRSVTGIELGAESCVLARVRATSEAVWVPTVYGLRPDEAPPTYEPLTEHLRRVRRASRFPRRARVVVWALHESAARDDAATRATLSPLTRAGFVIDDVLRPADALAILARYHPRAAERDATAWLALNKQGAAIAIVRSGELLFSREFDWNYRTPKTQREELLQRYSLVAHLAPELRHGFDIVRAKHKASVDGIVTCGDLPDLRSLTMPLIEELDLEVETLDSLDGLEMAGPTRREEIGDRAPALRLACAAGIGRAELPLREPSRVPLAVAAGVLIALALWGANRLLGGDPRQAADPSPAGPPAIQRQQSGSPRPAPGPSPADSPVAPPAAGAAEAGSGTPSPAATAGPVEPAASQPSAGKPREADAGLPAATTGRQTSATRPIAPPEGAAARPAAGPSRTDRAPVPLTDPLPVVNSILVSPDRRLAVLDGAIVREGEAVGPRVLIRIESAGVVLREPSGHEVRIPIRRRVGAPPGGQVGPVPAETRGAAGSYTL